MSRSSDPRVPTNIVDRVDVVLNDERLPVLYDAKGRPLVRPAGFRKIA